MPLFAIAAMSTTPAGAQPAGETCYAVSDLGGNDEGTTDNLISITGGVVTVEGAMGTNDAEAFAIRPGDTGYAWSGVDGLGLVTVDLTDGTTADAGFDVPGPKVEGLTWANVDDQDLTNDILYVVRTNGVVQGYDPTGAAIGITANVAGGGFPEGTDIAWDPVDDLLYAIRTDDSGAGDNTQIVTIPANNTVTPVGTSAPDLEGLGFTDDGTLIGTTGDDAGQADNLYVVSQADGAVGASLADLSSSIDNEDVDCLSPEFPPGGSITASASATCVGIDLGQITVAITHAGGDPVVYTASINGAQVGNGSVSAAAPNATAQSAANLADGSYTVTVTGDGDPVGVANSPITIDCSPPDEVISATAVFVECVNGAGNIDVEITYVSGSDPADYNISWANAQQNGSLPGTIAVGATVTRTVTGIVDGTTTFTVDNTTGGASFEVLSTPITFDCPPPEIAAAAAFEVCEADAGIVEVTITYVSGSEAATYEISWANAIQAGTLTQTIAANAPSFVQPINGLVDGTTTITVTNTSVNPAEVVLTQPITFDCDQPEITATATVQDCMGDMAAIDVVVTNASSTDVADYEVSWMNPAITSSVTGTVDPLTTETETTGLLDDSDTVVTVTNTTGDGVTVVYTETLTIDCVPPVPGEISATAAPECADNTGTITVTVVHSAGELPVTYRVEVSNQNNTTGAIAATDDPVDITYTPLADGGYDVTVFDTSGVSDTEIFSDSFVLVCNGDMPDAIGQTTCTENLGGNIEFTVSNPTEFTADFVLSVEGQADVPVPGVAAFSQQSVTAAGGLAEGTYQVLASANGIDVYSDMLVVDCTDDPTASVVSIDCATAPGEGVAQVATLEIDNSEPETTTVVELTFDSTMTVIAIPSGDVVTQTLPQVAPGSYPVSLVTDTGIVLLNEIIEIGEPCLTADPAVFCSVFNPTEGKVRVELNNTSDQPLMATIGVQTSDGVLRNTPPNGGTVFTIPANFLTNVTLTRVVPDGEYEIYVSSNGQIIAVEVVTLTCQNPIVESMADAEIGAVDCTNETIPVMLETSGGNTSVLFVATVDGGTVILPNVTPPTVTVNANTQQTLTIGPLADDLGGYDVVITANGQVLDSDSVVVNCDVPGIPKADVTAPICGANNGMPALGGFFDVVLEVMGGTRSEDFIVSINGNPFETVTVDGSSSTTIPFGPFPDGIFAVSVTVDGTEVMGSPEIATVDCRTVTAVDACDATNVGSIILNYVNDSPSPVTFTGTVDGLNPESVDTTVAPGDSTTDTRTPLIDGTYSVSIAEDGIEVFAEDVVVDCVVEGTPSAVIGDIDCASGGTIEVVLTVTGGTVPEDFTISVDGAVAPGQPVTIPGDSSAITSVTMLADGTYLITVDADGMTVLTESVDVSCAQVEIAATCVDGAGQLVFTYTNGTAATAVFESSTIGQVSDNAGASVAAGATGTVTTSTPLPDGTYVVRTTAGAVEIDVSTVDVDCEAGLTITDACIAENGVIRVAVNNSTDADVTVDVVITPAGAGAVLTQTETVAAGETETIARSGRPDGAYTVQVSIDGTLVQTQTVLIDCDDDPIDPDVDEVILAVSCLAGNGRIDTNIVNTGSAAATYRLEFQGLSPRENTVAAGDWWRMPVTGRPDGTYNVVILRNGVEVANETVTVACDTAPPVVDDDEVRVVNACRAGNGYLLFQFVNNTAAAKGYVIVFEGVGNRSTTAAAYGQAVRAVTGRPDGTYDVTIFSAGVEVESFTVTVDCDA